MPESGKASGSSWYRPVRVESYLLPSRICVLKSYAQFYQFHLGYSQGIELAVCIFCQIWPKMIVMTPEQERDYLKTAPHAELGTYLAAKVRRARLHGKETQESFAERAGIALRTYTRFELYGQGTLETFLRALTAIGRNQYLFMLFPGEAPPSKPTLAERVEKMRKNRS